jgi:hypothetical protein
MAISSYDEFDVVLHDLISKVDRLMLDRPSHGPLAGARRELGLLATTGKKRDKVGARQVQAFTTASQAIRAVAGDDADIDDQLYALGDFIDQHRG